MLNWKKWSAGSFGLALIVAMVFQARTAGAQISQIFGSDPEGVKQTDDLIKKAEDLVKETVSARGQISKTLDTYNAIFASETTDVRKAYRDVEGQMEDTEERREEVRKKVDEANKEADAYFGSWSESLQQITDPELRKRSEGRMAETRANFDGVIGSVDEARKVYEPFITKMKDQWIYLGHDLNPSGIASLKPDATKLNQEGAELLKKIDASTDKGNKYIASLRSSRPTS